MSSERVMKIVLVGDSGVGKSSLFVRYCDGQWRSEGAGSTVADDTKTKVIEVVNKQKPTQVTLHIHDTIGQERFGNLTSSSFRSAQGVLLCYDITDKESFDHLTLWRKEITKYAPADVVICLLGLKIDLVRERVIPTEDGQSLSESWKAPFFEVSAKTNTNINEAVMALAQRVMGMRNPETRLIKSPSIKLVTKKKTPMFNSINTTYIYYLLFTHRYFNCT